MINNQIKITITEALTKLNVLMQSNYDETEEIEAINHSIEILLKLYKEQ